MKKNKLLLIISTAVCFFTASMTMSMAGRASEPIIVNVAPGEVNPVPTVVQGTTIPEVTAGTKATLTLPIQNSSAYNAKNIVVKLDSAGKPDFPFVYDELGISKKIEKLNAKETVDVVFELEVDEYAQEGRHAIKLNYTYSNTMGNDYTSSEMISVKVINKNTPPKLTVSNVSFGAESVRPDQQVPLNISVKNIGTMEAKDVKVTLLGLKTGEFTVSNYTDTKYLSDIKGQETMVVSYDLKASKDIVDGAHSLEVKMEYKDGKKNALTETNQIFIPSTGKTSGQEGKPSITFDNIQYPMSSIKPGSDFPVSLDITNRGNGKAENVKIWLASDKEIISKSLSTIMLDALDKEQTKKVDFSLSAVADAATKNYPIAINVEYEKKEGDKAEKVSLTQYIGVYIENEATSKSVPKIIVNQYAFEPAQIKAGESFQLNLSFLNTSRLVSTNNIKISLSSDEGIFQPVNTSSTFYVDALAPKSVVEKSITLITKSDAAPKPYLITINYEYEDGKGNPYTAKDTISIPVVQAPRLVTGEITVSPEAFAGQPVPITAEFFNMGKSTLYNLMIQAKGDFQVQGTASYYVGNFEPGKSDVFDVTVIPKATGESKGTIVFSFEDSSGKQTLVEKEFTMNIMEMPAQMGMEGRALGNIPQPEGKKTKKPIYFIAGGIGLALVIVVFAIVLRKKIKSRKELALDE